MRSPTTLHLRWPMRWIVDADDNLTVGILRGEGNTFCSGMDLKEFARTQRRAVVPGRGLGGLAEAPPAKPLIAAVEGYALAGGFELALACDLIVAADNASFGLPEVKRGLFPDRAACCACRAACRTTLPWKRC